MINNLGPSGILAAPYVAYSACPNDAESDTHWGPVRLNLARGAMRDGVGFTVDGKEQQIQRANRHLTRPTRIRATK
jgi:hypothetical protein